MDLTKLVERRTVVLCLLASVLIHLVGMAALNGVDDEGREQLARLQVAPVVHIGTAQGLVAERFVVEGVRAPGAGGAPVAMEQLKMEAYEALVPEEEVAVVPVAVPKVLPQLRLQEEFARRVTVHREGGLAMAEAVLKALADVALSDTVAGEMLDLLRIRDLAAADRERAMVIADPEAPKSAVGYVNFTYLRLRGAGSFSSFNGGQNDMDPFGDGISLPEGRSSAAVSDLARYMRDHTGILARTRSAKTQQYFLSRELLKDPIHFLFQGGGMPIVDAGPRVRFFPEERALLGEYLRGGGFLYVEGSNRYLRDMVAEFEAVLGADGRLVQLPAEHPIYRAYYSYAAGFPRERRRPLLDVQGPAWYYPGRFPNSIHPEGLWGVQVGDDLVAVLSDLGLLSSWSYDGSLEPDQEPPAKSPYLQAGVNVVLYALTRPHGLTAKRDRPLWAAATGVTRLVSGAQPF